MTYSNAIIPVTEAGEEPFSIEEVFFSRTDKRGVIRSGNAVFHRVAGYGWDKLIGAPHRIIRNPDMPKAVFWLLWKTIQADSPMVAYVKNQSVSGRWYWVLAVVVPLADGYLSAGIKPGTALLAQIKALYSEVQAAEQSLTVEKAADLLVERLSDLGFATYSDFASQALQQELAARDTAIGEANHLQARVLANLGSVLDAMRAKQADLNSEFQALQSIPTNMRIIASRLEPSGGPISAISDNYKYASAEISHRLEAFAGSDNNMCKSMSDIVRQAMSVSAIARLLSEVRSCFDGEVRSDSPVRAVDEQLRLKALSEKYLSDARDSMMRAVQVSGELNVASGEIRRMMLGLDTIRVMGRVESGRLGPAGVGLSATIDQLDTRHARIADLLQGLMDLSANAKAGINAYVRQVRG